MTFKSWQFTFLFMTIESSQSVLSIVLAGIFCQIKISGKLIF